jgi:hypothetical protein
MPQSTRNRCAASSTKQVGASGRIPLSLACPSAANFPLQVRAGNTKGGSATVLLTSSLTGLDYSVLKIKTRIVSRHRADSNPVKLEVNCTVILPP